MFSPIRAAALVLLAATIGCADRTPPTAPAEGAPNLSAPGLAADQDEQARLEDQARRLARALKDPSFRAYVKAQLDRSPYQEHKVHFQRFLDGSDHRALQALARGDGSPEEAVTLEARATAPLEFYFPVPEHRARWTGDEHLLVATALRDHDIPVAFDLDGGRHFLDPAHPPQTPVLALEPVETDFDRPVGPAGILCNTVESCGGGGGGGNSSPPLPGLYLTSSHFVQDFEGWLKGSPEFEIHIMGQSGATDSLVRYQCSGEKAPGSYWFDQNSLDWSGSALLFSQAQLDAYKLQHPGQSFRIVAMEDDDTACEMKVDQDRWKGVVAALGPTYKDVTGAIDTLTSIKVVKAARSLQNFLAKLASWIKSNDDLIGNAIEDKVVGQFYPNANWVIKGESNATNGWIKLEMR